MVYLEDKAFEEFWEEERKKYLSSEENYVKNVSSIAFKAAFNKGYLRGYQDALQELVIVGEGDKT